MEYKDPEVKLIAYSRGINIDATPDEIAAYAARACFTVESTYEILKDKLNWSKKQIAKKKGCSWEDIPDEEAKKYFDEGTENILKNSSGRGHTAVLDQSSFTFNIVDLPRAATMQLCFPHYLMHLQQSLRRANAKRGFYLPSKIINSKFKEEVEEILNDSFKLYEKLSKNNIPIEDARYILPLYTKTTITTSGDARELINLYLITKQGEVPSVVKSVVEQMIEVASKIAPNLFKDYTFRKEGKSFSGFNKEIRALYPSQQLYASNNEIISEIIKETNFPLKPTPFEYKLKKEEIEEILKSKNGAYLSILKHIHNLEDKVSGILVPLSLAADHQLIRERTLDEATESIYSAIKRKQIVIPPSILNSDLKEEYIKQNEKMIKLYEKLVESNIPKSEAVGIIPSSLQIYNIVHVNGWNATLGYIPKRYCIQAQWEIRAITSDIVNLYKEKSPIIAEYLEPRGDVWGICPEYKPCPSRDKTNKCPKVPGVNTKIFHKLK